MGMAPSNPYATMAGSAPVTVSPSGPPQSADALVPKAAKGVLLVTMDQAVGLSPQWVRSGGVPQSPVVLQHLLEIHPTWAVEMIGPFSAAWH
eukprot:Skav230068  [mRNA]  locus=scaffold2569:38062:45008:+ [translate_table: standard]